MANVDGIKKLQSIYNINVNEVMCRARKNERHETTITLCTPSNAWTKCLTITGSGLMERKLKCGDKFGNKCEPPNDYLKSSSINLGNSDDPIYIQFEKSKDFGKLSDYGTIELSGSDISNLDIVFFWPNDSEGSSWKDFKKMLGHIKTIPSEVESIQDGVIVSGKTAAKLMESLISLTAAV